MRFLLLSIGALFAFGGCDDDDQTVVPTSVTPTDLATPSPAPVVDMARAPSAADMAAAPTVVDMAMAPSFPMMASVTVGPGGSLTYSPATVNLAAGGTVTWTWDASGVPHSVTSNTGVFDSGVKTSGTFSFTFPTAGSFPYHCTVHGTVMSGTVVVH